MWLLKFESLHDVVSGKTIAHELIYGQNPRRRHKFQTDLFDGFHSHNCGLIRIRDLQGLPEA